MRLINFTIAAPFALGIKFLSDPLRLKPKKIGSKESFWIPREDKEANLENRWNSSEFRSNGK